MADLARPVEHHAGEILCPCVGLSRAAAAAELGRSPGQSFDDFLKETGAGQKCTACLLDLEYFFVEDPNKQTTTGGKTTVRSTRPPLKNRLFRILDRVPPSIPQSLESWMPVLAGSSVRSWLWVANHPMLYGDAANLKPVQVDLQLYGADGNPLASWHRQVDANEHIRVDVSDPLLAFSEEPEQRGTKETGLAIGSLRITQKWRGRAVRGTTRPQLEIVTARAASVVHSQGVRGAPRKRFSLKFRDKEQRFFFSVLNVGSKPMPVSFRYPANFVQPDCGSIDDTLTVPPFGARLYAMEPPLSVSQAMENKVVEIDIAGAGVGKIHVLCAARDLSRFSVDHL